MDAQQSAGLAAILIAIAVFLVMYAIFAPRKAGTASRLTEIDPEYDDSGFNRYVRPMLRNFIPQTPLAAQADSKKLDKTRELLISSGNPWKIRAEEFMGIQVLFACIGAAAGMLLFITQAVPFAPPVLWLVALPAVGFLMPYSYHNTLRQSRSDEIQRQLPEAIDLLVITLASGQNFEPALAQVAPTLPKGLLRDELIKVNHELNAGRSMNDALLDFAHRSSSDEAESFAKAIVQSQKLGSDVSETLENQSESARSSYENRIERKISRLSSIMMIPLVFTMIPALMIVIIAPTMSSMAMGF